MARAESHLGNNESANSLALSSLSLIEKCLQINPRDSDLLILKAENQKLIGEIYSGPSANRLKLYEDALKSCTEAESASTKNNSTILTVLHLNILQAIATEKLLAMQTPTTPTEAGNFERTVDTDFKETEAVLRQLTNCSEVSKREKILATARFFRSKAAASERSSKLLARRNYSRVQKILENWLEKNPKDIEALALKALTLFDLGTIEETLQKKMSYFKATQQACDEGLNIDKRLEFFAKLNTLVSNETGKTRDFPE